MKKGKLIILSSILIFLLIYVFAVELKNMRLERERKEQQTTLFGYKIDDIISFELDGGSGKITVERDDDQWLITSPINYKADKSEIEKIIDIISREKWGRSISDASENLINYGLKNPHISIDILLNIDSLFSLRIGDLTPTGESVYAKYTQSPEIKLLPLSVQNGLRKKLYDLRDKKILDFNPAMVKHFTISERDNIILEFEKNKEGLWQIVKPFEESADQSFIDDLLTNILNSKPKEFIDVSKDNYADYGLDKVEKQVRFVLNSGEERFLNIGSFDNRDSNTLYVFNPNKTPIFAVNKIPFEKIDEPLSSFRGKKLLELNTVNHIAIRDRDKYFEFEKEDSDWLIKSLKNPVMASEEIINNMLSDFRAPKGITGFTDKSIKFDDNHYMLFKQDDFNPIYKIKIQKEEDTLYYSESNQKRGIFIIRNNIASWLDRNTDYFIEKQFFPDRISTISSLEFSDNTGKEYHIQCTPDKWKLVLPEETLLSSEIKSSLYDNLNKMEFKDYGIEKNDDSEVMGWIKVGTEQGKIREIKIVGKEGEDYLVSYDNKPTLYKISSSYFDRIVDILKEIK